MGGKLDTANGLALYAVSLLGRGIQTQIQNSHAFSNLRSGMNFAFASVDDYFASCQPVAFGWSHSRLRIRGVR